MQNKKPPILPKIKLGMRIAMQIVFYTRSEI